MNLKDMFNIKELSETIIKLMQEKKENWQQPFLSLLPYNCITKRSYTGFNSLYLQLKIFQNNLKSTGFLTYNESIGNNIKINKGSKLYNVLFWKILNFGKSTETENIETEDKRAVPFLKYYSIFNLCDTDSQEKFEKKINNFKNENIENLYKKIVKDLKIEVIAGEPAFSFEFDENKNYKNKKIAMPRLNQMTSPKSFISAFFHELMHYSKFENEIIQNKNDEETAIEELTAEIGAIQLCNFFEIEKQINENSIKYLQSWITLLKNDYTKIYSIAAKAQKRVNYIIENCKFEENIIETEKTQTEKLNELKNKLIEQETTKEITTKVLEIEHGKAIDIMEFSKVDKIIYKKNTETNKIKKESNKKLLENYLKILKNDSRFEKITLKNAESTIHGIDIDWEKREKITFEKEKNANRINITNKESSIIIEFFENSIILENVTNNYNNDFSISFEKLEAISKLFDFNKKIEFQINENVLNVSDNGDTIFRTLVHDLQEYKKETREKIVEIDNTIFQKNIKLFKSIDKTTSLFFQITNNNIYFSNSYVLQKENINTSIEVSFRILPSMLKEIENLKENIIIYKENENYYINQIKSKIDKSERDLKRVFDTFENDNDNIIEVETKKIKESLKVLRKLDDNNNNKIYIRSQDHKIEFILNNKIITQNKLIANNTNLDDFIICFNIHYLYNCFNNINEDKTNIKFIVKNSIIYVNNIMLSGLRSTN